MKKKLNEQERKARNKRLIEKGAVFESMYRPPKKVRPKFNDWEIGIFMTKYSFKFKKKVVLEYLDSKGGVAYLSRKYGLDSNEQLRIWINAYKAFSDEGIVPIASI